MFLIIIEYIWDEYDENRVMHTVPETSQIAWFLGLKWGRQDPGGPHAGPINLTIRGVYADCRSF